MRAAAIEAATGSRARDADYRFYALALPGAVENARSRFDQ